MRNKEMLKRISVKCVTAIMAAAVAMSAFGAVGVIPGMTATVYAANYDTTDDVPEDNDGHRNLAADDSLTTNTSTIHENNGTIGTNAPGAVVEVNNNIVTDNYGDVANQGTGSVGTNHVGGTVSGTGSIGENYGNVTGGIVTDNYASGTVTGGDSRITGDNFGTANGIGQVENNYANVTDANVTNNYSSGTVNENTKDNVQVDNNFGGTLGAGVDATNPSLDENPGPNANKLNQTDPNPPAPAPAPQPQPEPPQDNGNNNDNSGSVDNSGAGTQTPQDQALLSQSPGSLEKKVKKMMETYNLVSLQEVLDKIYAWLEGQNPKGLDQYTKYRLHGRETITLEEVVYLEYIVRYSYLPPNMLDIDEVIGSFITRYNSTRTNTADAKDAIMLALRMTIDDHIEEYVDDKCPGYIKKDYSLYETFKTCFIANYKIARENGSNHKQALRYAKEAARQRVDDVLNPTVQDPTVQQDPNIKENRKQFVIDNNLTPGAVTFVGGSFDGQNLVNGMSVPTAGQATADGTLQGGAAADGTLQGDAAVQAQQLQAMQAAAAAQAAALQNLGLGQNPQDAVMAALLGQTGQTAGQQTAGDMAQDAMMQTDQANPAIDMANGGQDRGILFLPQNNGMAGIQENPTQVPAGGQDIAAILAALALANTR